MSKMSQLDMDRQNVERLTDVVNPPTFAKTAVAGDPLNTLIDDVKASTIEFCAGVAEIYRIPDPKTDWQHGYNVALTDIVSKLREY